MSQQIRKRRRRVEMSADRPDHTADPEQPLQSGFAEGQADPEEFPLDEKKGRFSKGQEELPGGEPEKHVKGRFSEGQEELGDEDPEKHVQGRFDDSEEEE
jgi:hypothetical protein